MPSQRALAGLPLAGMGLAVALTALTPTPVAADNFGGEPLTGTCNGIACHPSLANNQWHSISFHGTTPPTWRTAISDATGVYNDHTDLITSVEANNFNNVDVRVFASSTALSGFLGLVHCVAGDVVTTGTNQNRTCYRQSLKIDTSEANSWANTYTNPQDAKKMLAMHELGHTIGLRHPNQPATYPPHSDPPNTPHPNPWDSCMHSNLGDGVSILTLTAHDLAHINNHV